MVHYLTEGKITAFAIHGLPGSGKSALAVVLAHHPDILDYFADGILWASLGPTFNVKNQLAAWAIVLGVTLNTQESDEQCALAIRSAIGQRKILLIIDDAWQAESAQLLRCGGPNCKHVLTTRDLSIARVFAGSSRVIKILPLEEDYALQLLETLAPEACATDPAKVRKIVKAVGCLPLALVLIGSFLAFPEHSLFPMLGQASLEELADPAHRLQLADQRLGSVNNQKVTLQETILLSLDHLSPVAVDAFYALGAFAPDPASFDLNSAQVVTGVEPDILALLVARNLVEIHDTKRLAIHQVLGDVSRTKVGNVARMRHAICYATAALQAYQDYIETPEDYLENSDKRRFYQEEQDQIGCAYRWVLDHEPSHETDKLLIQFTHLPAFVAFAEPNELIKKIERLGDGVAAADRIGDVEASSKFRRATSFHLQNYAFLLKLSGNLSKANNIYQQAIKAIQVAKDHPIDWIHDVPGKFGEILADMMGEKLEYSLIHELGETYRELGEPAKAIECYQNAMDYVKINGGQSWHSSLLGDLFSAYFQMQEFQQASDYLRQRLAILEEISDSNSEIIETLANLGACAFNLGDKQAALDYVVTAIEKSQKKGQVNTDPKLTASAGMDLVTIPWDESNILSGCLAMAAEISDEFSQPDKAANFRVYHIILLLQLYKRHTTTEFEQAKTLAGFFGKSKLSEYEKRGKDILTQSVTTLEKLASYYLGQGNNKQAIQYREIQLDALRTLNDQAGQAYVLGTLGLLHSISGNMSSSFDCYEQCIVKMRETRDQGGLIMASQILSNLYIVHGDYYHAVKILDQALKAARNIADAQSELDILKNLGITHILMVNQTGQLNPIYKAIKYFEAGYDLAVKLGDQTAQVAFQDALKNSKQEDTQLSLLNQGRTKKGKARSRRK